MGREQYETTVTSDAGEEVQIIITQFGADRGAKIFFSLLSPLSRSLPKALEGVAPMMTGVFGELREAIQNLREGSDEEGDDNILDRPLDKILKDVAGQVIDLFSDDNFVDGMMATASGVAEACALVAEHIWKQGTTETLKELLHNTQRVDPQTGKKVAVKGKYNAIYRNNYGELLETIVHVLLANYRGALVSLGKRLVPVLASDEA